MSPAQWHGRVPFCGRVVNESFVDFGCATPEVMALELGYAARAGISFWAFVQYEESSSLSAALQNYLAATDTHGVNFAALMQIGGMPLGPKGDEWTAFLKRYDGYFSRAEYETVGPQNNPLVFLFGGSTQVGALISSHGPSL